jgi:hypothetical protein
VIGDDGLSSYMLLNNNQAFVNSSILYLFQFIFKYSVIPKDFNNVHIIPIVKDRNKSNYDLSNLRPISYQTLSLKYLKELSRIKFHN